MDPFCVEKNLRSWASSRIIARGRDYYRKGCVLSLDSYSDDKILAQVEGSMPEPYRVEIQFDASGIPVSQCSCPFDWEPLCKHAVAVLIAWQQQETGSEAILGSLDQEVIFSSADSGSKEKERVRYLQELAHIEKEARRLRCQEQGLKILQRPSSGPLGSYRISSGNPNRHQQEYQVVVRDAQWQHASCQCLDFRTNELGTCKHIELVKRSFASKRQVNELIRAAESDCRVSIYLGSRESHLKVHTLSENIRCYIPPRLQKEIQPLFSHLLDEQSWYRRNGQSPLVQKEIFTALPQMIQSRVKEKVTLDMDSSVWEVLDQEKEDYQWENQFEEIARPLNQQTAWHRSIEQMPLQLHPYQVEGILFAVKKRRAFIGDDMGLGKTVQAIGTALFLKELGEVKRVLVITPASLKFQWKREIEKVSSASVRIIIGSARERQEQYKQATEFFILVNYELLYRDLETLFALKPDFVVLDEAQRIKNWETKIAQTIKQIKSPFQLVLTGTPLQNRLAELHSIAEFLNPRALGASWKLIPSYAELDENDKIVGYSNLDHLRKRMSQFLIRRERQEVLSQLPKRTDNHFWTPLTPTQQEAHADLAHQVAHLLKKWQKFKRLTQEDTQRLFRLLTCMRIVCNAYGQYDWKSIEREVLTAQQASASLKQRIHSPKLEEFSKVIADLLENPQQKVVIFSQWERMLRLAELYIRDLLESCGAHSVIFSGALSARKREAQIRQFLEDPNTRIFFSTDAGGVGLNLQEGANCVINLEIPWNPAVLEQRIGRVHRMGQQKSVQAIYFISAESIEERILSLVSQKKALFSGIFDEKTHEIHFTKTQANSFIEKVKMIVPEPVEMTLKPEELKEKDPSKVTETPAEQLSAVEDSIGIQPDETFSHPEEISSVNELDLAPLLSVAGNLLENLKLDPSIPQNLKIQVSENQDTIHLSFPKPVKELLRGFKPLFEALLKI